jgi:hypothetical protein
MFSPSAHRKKQKIEANTAEDEIIDITDDDFRPHQPVVGPANLALSKTIRSTSKLAIRAEPSSRTVTLGRSRSSDGGTRRDPIVLDSSSPAKLQITADLTKPTYSIFAPRKSAPQFSSPSKPGGGKRGQKFPDTPLPNIDSQHVRGPQSQFIVAPLYFARRASVGEIIDVDQVTTTPLDLSGFRKSIMNQGNQYSRLVKPATVQIVQSSDKDKYIKTIPDEHVSAHPAISHLVQRFTLPSSSPEHAPSQDLWTDKWSPQCANHVLGNEDHALYLRDWLSALELQLESRPESPQKPQPKSKLTTKATTPSVHHETQNVKSKTNTGDNRGAKRPRPRVVRSVNRIRRRKKQRVESDEDEDWIVDTDEEDAMEEDRYMGLREESEEDAEDEDDVEFCRKQTLSRLRRMESSPAPAPQINHALLSDSDLHNTLLLAGPPGSGKTAAVYACAKELDWDVFEVYPGVGKRSGHGLDQLVGEVGKNHLVRKAGGPGKKNIEGKKNAFVEIFGKGLDKVDTNVIGNNETEGEPIEVGGDEGGKGGVKHINGDFGFLVTSGKAGTTHSDPSTREQVAEPMQGVRQSLILLEEVDILFEEDRGFWTAVISIIKGCRRPVIMTCNGELSR